MIANFSTPGKSLFLQYCLSKRLQEHIIDHCKKDETYLTLDDLVGILIHIRRKLSVERRTV